MCSEELFQPVHTLGDFPTKPANPGPKRLPRLASSTPQIPGHVPTGAVLGVNTTWTRIKFGSDPLRIGPPCEWAWRAGPLAGSARGPPARPSSRSGVTLPAAVSRPAPPRPARPGSHTVTCVTDTGRASWRTPQGEGARARARPLYTASLSFSLATGRRPSPSGGARIGGKRTSRTRRAE